MKRGNSSNSQQNQSLGAAEPKSFDQANDKMFKPDSEEEGDEEYEPQFDEDDDDAIDEEQRFHERQQAAAQAQAQQAVK